MAAGKVIQAVLRLQDNMSGGILKAARNAKKAGADINNDMMQATRQVVAWKINLLAALQTSQRNWQLSARQPQPPQLADSLRWII